MHIFLSVDPNSSFQGDGPNQKLNHLQVFTLSVSLHLPEKERQREASLEVVHCFEVLL